MALMFAEWRRRSPAIVLTFAAAAAMRVGAAELPPEIQADRYLVQAERQIQDGQHAEAVATLDKIVPLQRDHGLAIPLAFWFKHAQVAHEAGSHTKAVESATHYLASIGREGTHYLASLEILDASERELEAQRRREAEERMRREREASAERQFAERYRAARERLAAAGGGVEGAFADALTTGGYGPEMIVVPAGRFRMGCLTTSERAYKQGSCERDEKPVRSLRIRHAFAASRYEVTFEEWDRCVSLGECNGYRPDDKGWGRGSRPVINVSWDDAQAYVSWLSGETGQPYRLLSESEWEYAARAGSTTIFSYGNAIEENRANCSECDSRWDGDRTAPVGAFAPNAFGLHDMHGNVREWVEDCWNGSYRGGPKDGSAWTSGDCEQRVLRGGSWLTEDWKLRSAYRYRDPASVRYFGNGFRVARTLTP